MHKIVPCLWFDRNGSEAVDFYLSLFENSRPGKTTHFNRSSSEASGQPEGLVMTRSFELAGRKFMILNGGPNFKFTPAISFMVECPSGEEVERLWSSLSEGGSVLMELGEYPWSKKYGWVQDRFGLSWQLILSDGKLDIAPCLLFVNDKCGRTEEAIGHYRSQFQQSDVAMMERYGSGEPGKEGTVKFAKFSLEDFDIVAMDGPGEHDFTFTPAVSFMVYCDAQSEVDRFWDGLSEGGAPGRCGWLEDRLGISWQIVPSALEKLLKSDNPAREKRVMVALMAMDKLDIGRLQEAYEQV